MEKTALGVHAQNKINKSKMKTDRRRTHSLGDLRDQYEVESDMRKGA
jgi:hypothetical protein